MTLHNPLFAFVGIMVLVSVVLTVWVSPLFIWMTVFIGANMLQSAFTGFCPASKIMTRLGFKLSCSA